MTTPTSISIPKLRADVRGPVIGPDGTIYTVDVFGHLYALSPDGGLKWVVRSGAKGVAVDAIAITPDGKTIYALVRPDGRIAQIDATTGEVLGWAVGAGYDRLVGVVPW